MPAGRGRRCTIGSEQRAGQGSSGAALYSFEGFEVDVGARRLRSARGNTIELPATAFDLLCRLIAQRDGVVRAETLLELFPDDPAPKAELARCVWLLRRALGDVGGTQRMIQRVAGEGYRFVAPVEVLPAARRSSGPPSIHSGVVPRPDSSLVGRRDELAGLADALVAARAGRGQVRWLRGGAGLGKTRTIAEVVTMASRDGMVVCQAHCLDLELGPPLWAFQQIARQLIAESSAEALRARLGSAAGDLTKLIPELAQRVPRGGAAPPARQPSEERYVLFEALCALIVGAAADRPLLLTIDDIHWADEATLSLLGLLCERVADRPALVLVGSRSVDSQAIERCMGEVLELPHAQGIDLQPLAREEVGALLAQRGSLRDTLVGQVHGVSQGNPFVVNQLSSLLEHEDEESDDALSEPEGALESVVSRRLRQLPVECQGMLEVAAVLGREFRLGDLQRASVRSDERVVDLLYPALAGGIVQRDADEPERFRFTHETFREVLYGSLSQGRRRRLHRAVAESMSAAADGADDNRLSELALHYFEAAPLGVAHEAIHYARLAAEQALSATAFEEAALHYRHGLEAIALLPVDTEGIENLHARLLLGLGDALRSLPGQLEEARAAYRGAFERARGAGDVRLCADAAMAHAGRGPIRSMTLREAGTLVSEEVEMLEGALAVLPPEDLHYRALLQGWLASAMYNSRQRARKDQLAFAAVELAREAGDPRALAEALLLRQSAVRGPAQLDARIAALDEILELTDSLDMVGLKIDALAARGWALLERGALGRAEHDMEAVQQLVEAIGHPRERRVLLGWRCMLLDVDGRFDEASALRQRELADGLGPRGFDQAGAIRDFYVRYFLGAADQMVSALEGVAERYPLPMAWHAGLASSYAAAGRPAKAREVLEHFAPERFGRIPDDHNWITSHAHLAEAVVRLGDPTHARVLYDKLCRYGERVIVVGLGSFCAGSLHRALGELAALLGHSDIAQAHLERAIAVDATLGATLWLNFSRIALVKVLRQSGEADDRRRADGLLEQVEAYLAARDVPVLAERARMLE